MEQNLPKRKNIRLKEYDYSNEGMYFITICTKSRIKLFGEIIETNQIKLTNIGKTVEKCIKILEQIYHNIILQIGKKTAIFNIIITFDKRTPKGRPYNISINFSFFNITIL